MTTELSAQFEAHLRGTNLQAPLDPTTPAGAWEAVRLLKLSTSYDAWPDVVGQFRWHAKTPDYDPYAVNGARGVGVYSSHPIAAVTAAWLAAAEKWSKK